MFRRDRVDRAFARYCRSGEPQALAEVFDRTAKELLRVALYLCGNRADAEDLLQRTFLSAIEGRARFDAGQRVLPWLCGIVVNHARSLQRDRARRGRDGVGVSGMARDPAEVVADRELQQRLTQLRGELVTPYREVLELHLEQGLNAKEIAARLGRPAGTVRTQLVRALELLRRRLPGGFVAGLVPFVPEAAALAKVKVAVVAAAKGAAPMSVAGASVVTAVAGGVVMANKLLVVVPLVAVALGVGVYLAMPDAPPPERSGLAAAPLPATAAGELAREQIAAKSEPAAMPANQRQLVAAPAASAGTAVIRGRCIDGEGNPVAGCKVQLGSYAPGTAPRKQLLQWREQQANDVVTDPEPLLTAGDGRFELHFTPPPMCRYDLQLQHPDFVGMQARWTAIAEHAAIVMPDAVLRRGTRLHGRVIDELGRPVPGVFLSMDPDAQSRSDGTWLANMHLGQRTALDGRFAQQSAMAPGDYHPTVLEHTVSSPQVVTIRGDQPRQEVQITLQLGAAAGEISGTVVDEAGHPIEDAMLYSVPDGAFARSVQDGSFRMVRAATMTKEPVRLRIDRDSSEPLPGQQAYAWGSEGVRVVLTTGVTLELHAHTADGAAVTDFRVLMFALAQSDRTLRDERFRRRADGSAVMRGIRRGSWALTLAPEDDALACPAFREFEVRDPSPQRVDVIVPRANVRQVQLRTQSGRPVAGSVVRLLDPGQVPISLASPMLALDEWESTNDPKKVLCLQEGTTDPEGIVRLSGPDDPRLELALLGPGHVPQLVQGVRFDTSEPLLVTVAVGAVMVGKVKPTGVYRELLRLAHLDEASAPNHKSPGFRIVGASGDAFPAPSEPAVLLRSDGSFRIDGAPPGRSKLLLQYSWSYGGFSVTGATEQVAELDLRDGETSQVDVDLGSFVTGELDAVVTHNGVPLANEVIFVGRGRPGGVVGSIGASTDGQGRLRLRERPGVFHFTWHRQGQPQVRCEGTAVLASGQTTSTTIAFATGEVRVRLLDPAGAPVAGLRLGARGLGDTNSVQLPASDRDGSVTTSLGPGAWSLTALPRRLLDPAALQAFAQAHRGDPGAYVRELLLIGDILVKPGATTDLELHLPPAWAQ